MITAGKSFLKGNFFGFDFLLNLNEIDPLCVYDKLSVNSWGLVTTFYGYLNLLQWDTYIEVQYQIKGITL